MPSHSAHRPSRIALAPVAQTLALGLAALAGAIASFGSLRSLAHQTGWATGTAWLLPVLLDSLAVAAWTRWLTSGEREAMRWGLAATGASIAGNTTSHLIAAGVITPGWQIVSVVGAIPPIVVAAVVSLAGQRSMAGEEPLRETCNVAGDWPMWEQEAAAHGADVAPSTTPEPVTVLALTAETQDATDARYADAWNVPLDLIERCRAAGVISVRGIRTTFSRTEDEARRANKALRHVEPAAARAKATAPIRQAVSA